MAPLAPDLLQELATRNPIGPPLPVEDVAAWWDSVEPRFDAYCYSGRARKRALLSWWNRVTEEELERARERAKRIRVALLEQALEQMQQTTPAPVQQHAWRARG